MREWPLLEVKVWGDYACFTRPEMKVERVSYPVMTPSAARGVLEAIFWKPEFRWRVHEIAVLKPVRYFSILRNEINTRQTERTARGWMASGDGGYFADADRTQRHTLGLRDVAYVIRAEPVLRADVGDDVAKYRDQFRRRVDRGQCYATPYFGCREFSAAFGTPDPAEAPIDETSELGTMLLDLDYTAQGSATPRFFDARLDGGLLRVPDALAVAGARNGRG